MMNEWHRYWTVLQEDLMLLIRGDMSLYVYGIGSFVWFCLFLLFLWWGVYKYIATRRQHKHYMSQPHPDVSKKPEIFVPSKVYWLITALFFALGYARSIGFFARWIRPGPDMLQTSEAYRLFLQSFWWHTRIVGEIVVGLFILHRQGLIVWSEFFRKGKPKRRKEDKDNGDL